jgi:hypothetical protein
MAATTLLPVTLTRSKSGGKSPGKVARRQGGVIFHTLEPKNERNPFIINKYVPNPSSIFCDFLRFLCGNSPEFAPIGPVHTASCSSRFR